MNTPFTNAPPDKWTLVCAVTEPGDGHMKMLARMNSVPACYHSFESALAGFDRRARAAQRLGYCLRAAYIRPPNGAPTIWLEGEEGGHER